MNNQGRSDSRARVEAVQRVLEQRIEALAAEGGWRRYLDFQARLHRYSPNNVMLIWAQHAAAFAEGRSVRPEPSYVAGYRTWQALGRQVDRGQRGYAVLAPVLVRRPAPADGPSDSEPETRRLLRGFKVEHVFDVSQTIGDPVPEPVLPKLLTGAAPPGLKATVQAIIEEKGFKVETAPSAAVLGGANGITEWDSSRVRVRSDMDDAAQVKTLIHEAGHVLLHSDPHTRKLPRHRKEVEAESVAFIVAAAHGMPTDDYSFPYVMTWAGQEGADAVRATQARVARAAIRIIDRSPAARTSGGAPPALERRLAPHLAVPGIDQPSVQGAVQC